MSDLSSQSTAAKPPAASLSIHGDFLEKALPQWLVDATPARRSALKHAKPDLPAVYRNATPAQRKNLNASVKASAIAQVALDTAMATFKDVDAFARPLLLKALKDQYQVDVDVDKTLLCLRRTLAVSVLEIEVDSFEFLKLSMLQACLHNFEDWECKPGAYHKASGFMRETATAGTFESTTVNLTVSQFMRLCRSLDVGAQYQTYLKSFFAAVDASPEPPLRQRFIASQKATLKAAADYAVLTGDIEPADHAMVLSVVNGSVYPRLGDKRVWLLDMSLMKKRLTGCVYFAIDGWQGDELILYVPHCPVHPLKRYTRAQMPNAFKRLFTAREGMAADDPAPTAYQRFFSQFVPYDQRPYYFSQFTQKSADSPSSPLSSPWRTFVEILFGLSPVTQVKELPPATPAKMAPVSDPYLAPGSLMPYRGTGTFTGQLDLWPYLYEKHRDKVLADARAHAVATAEVDAKAREAKLAHLFEIGMLALNAVSMFVPVLGEVMLAVMAEQLLAETVEGTVEWAEGDKRAAKDHLIDVAENLAQIAVMSGVGAAVGKYRALKAPPLLENLSPVTLPNGETRLWKPDLKGYESPVTLGADAVPNAQGQYSLDGKTYIRLGGQVYEQVFDETLKQWRIKHPTQAEVYQPLLQSNGRGAWRHSLERPAEWDRLTLLRRIGHETESFTDTQLLKVAEVSGVSDNALRKMHMDLAAPPPELLDALRLFKADAGCEQVIDQWRGSQPIDERYLAGLPLVVDMPRWPTTRVLEVFRGAEFSGESMRYGGGRVPRGGTAQAPIRITRADVLQGRLPEVILAALEESQVTSLLGAEGARVADTRPQAFRKQIADYAQLRKPTIFDSLYAGTEPVDSEVRLLQRTCPGLSEAAAQEVLAHAPPDALKRLQATRRVPLTLLEEARWYAVQGRQVRAYAGLRSETMATAGSRRLALRALEKLPGWPDTVRLEVREGSVQGALLDSVGRDTAPDKHYLVKKGPRFQAFDARGQALSLPSEGDSFYTALMHAMPDGVRQSLGVPEVSQNAELQAKIIACADRYRGEARQWLQPQRKGFKPPVRVNDQLVGYYASGRAPAEGANLEARAQELYGLNEDQAREYILQLKTQGKDNKAIFTQLQNRTREYAAMVAELDEWAGPVNIATGTYAATYKHYITSQLKAAWRMQPLAGKLASAERLHMTVDEHLPPLSADFSHIRDLSLIGRRMSDADVEAFLARFPNVHTLAIGDSARFWEPTPIRSGLALTTLPPAVTRMASLKRLRFGTAAEQLAADFSSRLNSLTSLEELHLDYRGFSGNVLNGLDLSALVQLKRLQIEAAGGMTQWPASVEHLPLLERLDLSHTAIAALPARLYSGHEKLWAGLSLDWSRFSLEAFKPAYEYVRTYVGERGHLVDLHEMVSGYTKGRLASLNVYSGLADALHAQIMMTAQTAEARFAVIEALRDEYAGIFSAFYASTADAARPFRSRMVEWETGMNARLITTLEANWWAAVGERYGISGQASELEVPQWLFQVTLQSAPRITLELPRLPAASFAHVRTLRLRSPGVSTEQTRGFIRAFSGVQTLELNGLGLSEIPIDAGDLPALNRLDLANNSLALPALQAQLDDLGSLQVLDLSLNTQPLTALDVSALTQLKALNLRGTGLQAWPTGAERLPHLACLDLRDNQLTSLPPQVLANDAALMATNLAGNRFSTAGEGDLRTARYRVECLYGLPEHALARFERQSVSTVFPPAQTGLGMVDYLLALPQPIVAAEGAAGFVRRLQQLTPRVTEENALRWFEQLRGTGMTDLQIDTLLTNWHQEYRALIRDLNGWLYTIELPGPDLSRVHDERRLVALNIVECWQTGVSADAGYELSLHGLQTADLPELSVQFTQVHSLNLTGMKCSAAGAEGFLKSFPALRKLVLSGNELASIPEAVGRMPELEELVLDSNAITEPEPLYRLLGGDRLRRLNLSRNGLFNFNAQAFSRLETLDLSYNSLGEWPNGTLQARHLRTLNLCGNDLEELPLALFDGRHDALVEGTDLSENIGLTRQSFEQLRDYGPGTVMGWSREAIDSNIASFEESGQSDSDSDGDDDDSGADEPLETIADAQGDAGASELTSWLGRSTGAEAATRRQWWQQLAQEPDHERFFHLLERLRDTSEYRFSAADLTRRVWRVIESAVGSAQTRASLFAASATHGTCIDGRILTFSSMEVLVFVEQVLRDVPAYALRLKGQRLLELSRQLFRLEQVDTLAMRNARGRDEAEVRLEYRIGLTRGWPDGLELPGQPTHMAYGNPIRGQTLTRARSQVLEAEASEVFYERLVAHDYWVDYLKERYPDEFLALERDAARRHETVEDEYADREPGSDTEQRYNAAIIQLEVERGTARAQLLLTLSRKEVQAAGAAEAAHPRPESPQPGPSTRQ